MALNLHHLRLFTAVVDEHGFGRAAVALRLSQPAISRAIAELERDVGVPLLDRSGKAVRLTNAGERLHERARELFGVERAAEQELREVRGLERGVLRVAASTTIATYVLPALLGEFRASHPTVRISVLSANTRTVAKMLLEWRVDVALVEGPVRHDRMDVRPWMNDELVLIASPAHRFARDGRAPLAELAGEPFIVREPGSGTRDVTHRALEAHGVRLERTMRLGGTEAIKQGVAAGLGLAFVSKAAVGDQLALGKITVVPVPGLSIERPFAELRLRGRAASPTAQAFAPLLASGSE
ncbi:MAG TPA: LysR family transcriptional regulator [Gemmatimonadaceae bacterium]